MIVHIHTMQLAIDAVVQYRILNLQTSFIIQYFVSYTWENRDIFEMEEKSALFIYTWQQ